MEDFKNYMKKKNIAEIQIFLKHSNTDLVKAIAKRFKIPASTKRKELIIEDILYSIRENRPFMETDPPLHVMTTPQLRYRARQLNIDYSGLTSKQALRMAIVQKTARAHERTMDASSPSTTTPHTQERSSGSLHTEEELRGKTLPFLKDLAKSYKIKISKLSKNQLITLIMEAEMLGKVPKGATKAPTTLAKMRKNELIVLAEEKGVSFKGKSKADLVKILQSLLQAQTQTTGVSIVPSTSTPSSKASAVTAPVLAVEDGQRITSTTIETLRKDRKMTVRIIKDLLKDRKIVVPKGVTKRNDLLALLIDQQGSTTTTVSAPVIVEKVSKPRKRVDVEETEEEEEEEEEIVSEDSISPPSKQAPAKESQRKVVVEEKEEEAEDEDIVSMDDIHTPFEPVPLNDLLEEPSEKQLQEELYRCLQFYEHPR